MSRANAKSALLRLHSILGLALSLLLALIALTGSMMSFEDEIMAGLNAGMTRVEARATPKLLPDELVGRLQGDARFGKVSSITLTSDSSFAARARFARSDDRSRPSSVYVDPYDAGVIGTPVGEDFFATVRRLHRWLLLPGDGKGYGRQITGIAALCLIAMLVSGLVLRWPRRAGSVKTWLKPAITLRGRGLYLSLHAVLGTWVLPIYLVMTLTGLWYSFDWYKSGATWMLSGRSAAAAPAPAKAPGGRGPNGTTSEIRSGEASLSLDRVWSTFVKEQGRDFGVVQMTLPAAGTLVRVRSWPNDASAGEQDEFRIDAVTGEMASRDIYAEKTVGERAIARVLFIHRGSVFGWPGQLAFMFAALLMPLFVVTGLLLYLSRRRHQRLAQDSLRTPARRK